MSEREQVRKPSPPAHDEVDEQQTAAQPSDLLDDVDDLLDEIDDVLEENAEEFIRGYVQKGGQ